VTYKVARSFTAEARREIRALRKPREIRKDAWGTVIELLCAIAGYLPDPWPSERTLAAKLGRQQQNVHRTLVRAREWGLVSTTVRPLPGSTRDGQSYHLLCLSEPLRAAIARHHFQTSLDVRSKSYSYGVGQTDSPSGESSRRAEDGPLTRDAKVIPMPMNRWNENNEDAPAIGAPDPRVGPPHDDLGGAATVVRGDPATYLARRFERKWAAAKRAHRELRVSRGKYSMGMMIGYIRNSMLTECSPEHVEAYMDAFIEAAAAGDVIIKPGQFAFERFTAWWGREDVEDPAERLAAKQSAADAVAWARQVWAQQDAERDAGSSG
jgi:hypothetical protein